MSMVWNFALGVERTLFRRSLTSGIDAVGADFGPG